MVFFLGFATDWSTTSILLTHAWIHWATRGLCENQIPREQICANRHQMLATDEPFFPLKVRGDVCLAEDLLTRKVDDMFLTTAIYSGGLFRIEAADLAAHISWMATVNAKLPTGSNYTIEVGHNGNGNIGVCRNCTTSTRAKSLVCHLCISSLRMTLIIRRARMTLTARRMDHFAAQDQFSTTFNHR